MPATQAGTVDRSTVAIGHKAADLDSWVTLLGVSAVV